MKEGFRYCPVGLMDNKSRENTRYFTLNIQNLTGGASLGAKTSTIIEIRDDDGGAS